MRSGWIRAAVLAAAAIGLAHGADARLGDGRQVRLDDLPDGAVRQRLAALPQGAREHALATMSLMRLHRHDLPSLRIDEGGDVAFACFDALPAPGATAPASAATAVASAASLPISSPPAFHSKPGSANVAYLCFNGLTISGTAWNSSGAPASFAAKPFDLDGDATTFSDAEQTVIHEVWQRVAEDYAPFDIDITTEAPATWTSTTGRVLVTSHLDASGVAMPSSTAGGVAYFGVFGTGGYASHRPALVYYDNLGSREDYVAEACSHEFGHNLGLSHDGTSTSAYFGGTGSGATSWGPIMGTGYNRNVSQWSKGEYADANNNEDDLAIIAAHIAYRADDHGDTRATATALTVSSGSFSGSGIISRTSDVDVFKLVLAAGALSASATTWHSPEHTGGGDLDIRLRLLDGAGAVIAVADPSGAVAATLVATVAAGTYYLEVDGVGDPTTGYSEYASLGQYWLTGTSSDAPPSVALTAPAAGATLSGSPAVALAASASDSDGSIASVTFLVDGAVVGVDASAPFAASATGLADGSHTAVAQATDDAGVVTASAPIAFTIGATTTSPPPPVASSAASGGHHHHGCGLGGGLPAGLGLILALRAIDRRRR